MPVTIIQCGIKLFKWNGDIMQLLRAKISLKNWQFFLNSWENESYLYNIFQNELYFDEKYTSFFYFWIKS